LTTAAPASPSSLLTEELPSVERVRSGSGRGLWKRSGLGVIFSQELLTGVTEDIPSAERREAGLRLGQVLRVTFRQSRSWVLYLSSQLSNSYNSPLELQMPPRPWGYKQ
jgi:hypothetical protein